MLKDEGFCIYTDRNSFWGLNLGIFILGMATRRPSQFRTWGFFDGNIGKPGGFFNCGRAAALPYHMISWQVGLGTLVPPNEEILLIKKEV
jgi:hypothetical protein